MTLHQLDSRCGESFRKSPESYFICLISGTYYDLTFPVEKTPTGRVPLLCEVALMRIRIAVADSRYPGVSRQFEADKIIGIGHFQPVLIHYGDIHYHKVLLPGCQSIFVRRGRIVL